MDKPVLIWFDLTVATRHAEVSDKFCEYFDVVYTSNSQGPDTELGLAPGVAICLEFDYPDRYSMSLLRGTKVSNPHNPVLMVTAQHSEKLAVWAYRNRVSDYLVTPVPKRDLIRCRELIHAVQAATKGQGKRTVIGTRAAVPAEIPGSQRPDIQRLSPALHFVQQNFQKKIRNADVAALCRMSPHHFCHAFSERYSQTFQEYVLRFRIFQACNELQHPRIAVASVAYAVGFNDPSYFSRVFRRFVGSSPSTYRDQFAKREIGRRVADRIQALELPDDESIPDKRRRNVINLMPDSGLLAG